MSDGKGLKSRMDLLMERLAKEDAEGGSVQALTDAQKAAIADIRSKFEAKVAELEIMNQGKLAAVWDPEAREVLLGEIRREKERLAGERDAKIEKVKAGRRE
jgi:hypothetical protein